MKTRIMALSFVLGEKRIYAAEAFFANVGFSLCVCAYVTWIGLLLSPGCVSSRLDLTYALLDGGSSIPRPVFSTVAYKRSKGAF